MKDQKIPPKKSYTTRYNLMYPKVSHVNAELAVLREQLAPMLHAKSCYAGANPGGNRRREGGRARAENEQIQSQRKESQRISEVRKNGHCVCQTISDCSTVFEHCPSTTHQKLEGSSRQGVCVAHNLFLILISFFIGMKEIPHFLYTCIKRMTIAMEIWDMWMFQGRIYEESV